MGGMDVRIKATDYELTPEVSAYLDERIAAIEKLLASDAALARCEVEMGRAAGGQRHGDYLYFAEINLTYPGGETVHATNNAENVNTAIDDVKAEIIRQLRKQKTSHMQILRKGGAMLKSMMRFGRE